MNTLVPSTLVRSTIFLCGIAMHIDVHAATQLHTVDFLKKISIASVDSRASTTFTTKGALGDANKQQIRIQPGKHSYPYDEKAPTASSLTFASWIDQATLQQPVQKIQLSTVWKKDNVLGGTWDIVMTLLQKETELTIILDSIGLQTILSTQIVNLTPLITSQTAAVSGAMRAPTAQKTASDLFVETYLTKAPSWVINMYMLRDINYLAQIRLNLTIYPLDATGNADIGTVQIDSIDVVYVDYKRQASSSGNNSYTLSLKADDLMQKVPGIISPVLKPAGLDQYISTKL